MSHVEVKRQNIRIVVTQATVGFERNLPLNFWPGEETWGRENKGEGGKEKKKTRKKLKAKTRLKGQGGR